MTDNKDEPVTQPQADDGAGSAFSGDDQFDPTWSPASYAALTPTSTGSWRPVVADGSDVGVIYTDYSDSAGVWWVTQSDEVTRLQRFFQIMKIGNISAGAAYSAAQTQQGITFGPEQSGPFTKLEALQQQMMQNT